MIEYKHEEEVRVVVTCDKGDRGRMIDGIETDSMLHEVVISPLLPKEEFVALQKLILKAYPSVRMRRSELVKWCYEEISSKNGTNRRRYCNNIPNS